MRHTLFLAVLLPMAVLAQEKTAPKATGKEAAPVKAAPLSSAAPILDRPGDARMAWEYTGNFDVPPAHPNCKDLAGEPRKACTAQEVLKEIKAQVKAAPPATAPPASVRVKADLDVDQFGIVRTVKLDYAGDKALADRIIVALYGLPRFLPATKEGARAAGHCTFDYAPSMLFEEEGVK